MSNPFVNLTNFLALIFWQQLMQVNYALCNIPFNQFKCSAFHFDECPPISYIVRKGKQEWTIYLYTTHYSESPGHALCYQLFLYIRLFYAIQSLYCMHKLLSANKQLCVKKTHAFMYTKGWTALNASACLNAEVSSISGQFIVWCLQFWFMTQPVSQIWSTEPHNLALRAALNQP